MSMSCYVCMYVCMCSHPPQIVKIPQGRWNAASQRVVVEVQPIERGQGVKRRDGTGERGARHSELNEGGERRKRWNGARDARAARRVEQRQGGVAVQRRQRARDAARKRQFPQRRQPLQARHRAGATI